MTDWESQRAAEPPGSMRRSFVLGGGLAAGVALTGALSGTAAAQTAAGTVQTDVEPRVLDGAPMPEPPADKSAGPVRPGRGSMLTGKVAVVTGGARGIGRAIAVEFAANGADVVVLDIAGAVSPASDAKPATPEEMAETVRQIQSYGRRAGSIRADVRDIGALRAAADQAEKDYGKIDIVVANGKCPLTAALLG